MILVHLPKAGGRYKGELGTALPEKYCPTDRKHNYETIIHICSSDALNCLPNVGAESIDIRGVY